MARRELTVRLVAPAMQSVARSRPSCATVGSAMAAVVALYLLNPVITRVIGDLNPHVRLTRLSGLRALPVGTAISFDFLRDFKLNAFSQLQQRFAIIACFEHGHHLPP